MRPDYEIWLITYSLLKQTLSNSIRFLKNFNKDIIEIFP